MSGLEKTMFMDALVAAGVPADRITIIELPTEERFPDTTPSALDIPPVLQDDVILSGKSIATIRDSDGVSSSIVIFKPSPATRSSVKKYEGQDISLHISDLNGQFVPRHPQRITGSVYELGNDTMIVYTENQSC